MKVLVYFDVVVKDNGDNILFHHSTYVRIAAVLFGVLFERRAPRRRRRVPSGRVTN